MGWEIQLDNNSYSFTKDDLPALIHGEKHSGASLFTLTALSELYKQGHPILFITAHQEAKEEFLKQTNAGNELFSIEKEADIIGAETHQALFLSHQDTVLIPSLLSTLEDKDERIVLLHDIENLPQALISSFFEHPLTMYSGNLNMSSSKELLLQLKFNAKIFFSPLANDYRLTLPVLDKYQAYFLGRISQGKMHLTSHEQG